MIDAFPFPVSFEGGVGLASTNPMTVAGIKSTDNLLAVISIDDSTGVVLGRDVTDFTVTDGAIEAATIELDTEKFIAVWTSAPSS